MSKETTDGQLIANAAGAVLMDETSEHLIIGYQPNLFTRWTAKLIRPKTQSGLNKILQELTPRVDTRKRIG